MEDDVAHGCVYAGATLSTSPLLPISIARAHKLVV